MTKIADDSALLRLSSRLDVCLDVRKIRDLFIVLSKFSRSAKRIYERRTYYENGRDNGFRTEKDNFYTRDRGQLLRGAMAENFLPYAHSICHPASLYDGQFW